MNKNKWEGSTPFEPPVEPHQNNQSGNKNGSLGDSDGSTGGSIDDLNNGSNDGSNGVEPSHLNNSPPHEIRSLPQRKSPAHGVFIDKSKPTIVMINVCTKDRDRWLATDIHHALLRKVWKKATAWLVGRYVILPDHIHLFAAPGDMDLPLENWMKYWKSFFSRENQRPECRWQAGHWDTRMRTREIYEERWEYVRNNPVRHGLVKQPEDWPYSGELNDLDWW